MQIESAPSTLRLPDGRTLAYDDVGDRNGKPVFYIHGTPDCRLCRHPDDAVNSSVGVRLIAVDRPGYGDSDFDPAGTFLSFADDLRRLADDLALDHYAIFGWSGGGPFALATAARDPSRVTDVAIACTLAPIDALDQPDILDGADEQIDAFVEFARAMPPAEFAQAAAPAFAPVMTTEAEMRYWLLHDADAAADNDLHSTPGLVDHLAHSALYALHRGRDGLEHDLMLLASPFGFPLADVGARVHLWYGAADTTATLGMGRYLAQHLPNSKLTELPGASHFLPFPQWRAIVGELTV